MYYLILLLIVLLFPSISQANNFMIENDNCNLYSLESEKHEKIGKVDEKKNDTKPYIFKKYLKLKSREYVVLNDGEKDLLVNKNCGYQTFDEKPKLEKIFSDDETKNVLDSVSTFDKKILELCGYFGSHPRRDGLRNILVDEKYKDSFIKIYEGLNKAIYTKTEDREIFLSELLDVLFNTGGFSHTMCGIVKEKKMSGPHYYYRFLDLQKISVIGKNNAKKCLNFKKDTTEENDSTSKYVETISVDFIDKNNDVETKCMNSFVKDLNATKLLILSGLVGKIDQNDNKKIDTSIDTGNHHMPRVYNNKSCIYKDISNHDVLFKIVYNAEKKSLITIYPIKSDKCLEKNKGAEDKCFCRFVVSDES